MGEIADGLIDGTFDSYTGEYLGEGPGYPRFMDNRGRIKGVYQDGPQNPHRGLRNFIENHTSLPGDPDNYIKKYASEKNITGGSIKEISEKIQKNFSGFRGWCRANDPSNRTKK